MHFRSLVPILLLSVLGCEHHEKDSHIEVFKTPEQAAADRRVNALQAHKDLAVSVLRFARPDIEAKPGDGTTITLQADGVTHAVDLQPVEKQIAGHTNEERAILRKYLENEVRPFDVERLKALGFDHVKTLAAFELVNTQGQRDLQASAGTSQLVSTEIVSNVFRVSVIRRGEQGAAQTAVVPITMDLVRAWDVKPSDIDAAAMQGLRSTLKTVGDDFMETLPFGPVGRIGNLKSTVDPAVIVVPEFLAAVRKNWKMEDNLVLFAPGTTGITFVEEHNQKLLDLQVPLWKKQLVTTTNPLCDELLLRTPEKLGFANYSPTTVPATAPTTKRVYIAH